MPVLLIEKSTSGSDEANTRNGKAWYLVCLSADAIQAPVVQRLDNAIHRKKRYPVNKC